jgi:teichoic acid glycerol-phosphate primase
MDSHQFRIAGLIYGPDLHHLDHLAPLCVFMQIPLLVTEAKIEELAKRFYPRLEVILAEYMTVAEYLVSHFEVVFYSIPRDLFDEVFFFAQKIMQKKVHTIWCPHGNSDKGNAIFYMEALKKEEAALIYGKQMIELMQRKGVFDQLKGHVITGNYRYQFYLEHQSFFDELVKKKITDHLPQGKKTLFYAPTWQDYERSTSFFDATVPLIENLPEKYNLLIKLHPNLYLQDGGQVEMLIEKYEDRPNLLFLRDFPPIYPLLQIADIYIGDMSSIGYDFLVFNRPMFFLNQNARDLENDLGTYLFRCGVEIKPQQYSEIYRLIDRYFHYELRDFSEMRKEVYTAAFAPQKNMTTLKKEIEHLYTIFPEPEMNFF